MRRECLDHVLIYGPRHLERVLQAYVAHYCRAETTSGTGLGRTRRQADIAGPGDYPNAGRTNGRARRLFPAATTRAIVDLFEAYEGGVIDYAHLTYEAPRQYGLGLQAESVTGIRAAAAAFVDPRQESVVTPRHAPLAIPQRAGYPCPRGIRSSQRGP